MTPVFTSKLDGVPATIALATEVDHRGLATSLLACAEGPVSAIGSGGSVIVAEVLAACRAGLGHCATNVVTPMTYAFEGASLGGHAWLFSASGDNPDIVAAFEATRVDGALSVNVVTSSSEGALASLVARGSGDRRWVHVAPVGDTKDGFLATHSLVSAVTMLTLAADLVAGAPDPVDRRRRLRDDGTLLLSQGARTGHREALAVLAERDTLLLLHDPGLAAAAILVETSFWEAGICAVQRTDFRNFAHGRHTWPARHPERTFVLALTCERSRPAWLGIRAELPEEIPSAHLDFGRAGRGALFRGVLSALAVVEAAGDLRKVDPGRPGVAEFGRRIFARADLRDAVAGEDTATWRKRRAEFRSDPVESEPVDWPIRRDQFAADLSNAEIRALVLDYDGTVVSTQDRLSPPRRDILDGLALLMDRGVIVCLATGRGGSVGEMLRKHLPSRLHGHLLVGYYNGGHIAPLEVDIDCAPPESDAAMASLHAALAAEPGLFIEGWLPKAGRLQITIPFDRLAGGAQGVERVANLVRRLKPGVDKANEVRLFQSGHSVDAFPAWSGKLRVVEEARRRVGGSDAAVLCVGDSGDCHGNDHDLLGTSLGLSVDRVCHRSGSCWNPLPPGVSGPDGLARIISGLEPLRPGVVRLNVSVLFTK